jgi:hypothetical protein
MQFIFMLEFDREIDENMKCVLQIPNLFLYLLPLIQIIFIYQKYPHSIVELITSDPEAFYCINRFKEEPTLSDCACTRTFGLVIRRQI